MAKERFEVIDPDAVDELVGDIDGNGVVEFADFLILSDQFGTNSAESDLDGNGTVEFADYLLLAGNFGVSFP